MLFDRPRPATRPAGSKRLRDRIPSLPRLRGDTGRVQRLVSARVAGVLRSGKGVCQTGGTTTTESTFTATASVVERICLNGLSRSYGSIRFVLPSGSISRSSLLASSSWLPVGTRHALVLRDIVEVMQTMNRKKPRHDLIRILRGHTPDIQDTRR
jgi:hypothetical protein